MRATAKQESRSEYAHENLHAVLARRLTADCNFVMDSDVKRRGGFIQIEIRIRGVGGFGRCGEIYLKKIRSAAL